MAANLFHEVVVINKIELIPFVFSIVTNADMINEYVSLSINAL